MVSSLGYHTMELSLKLTVDEALQLMQTFERENKIYGTYDMMEKIVPSLSELSNHKNRQLWNILNLFKLSSDDAYVLASLATIYKKDCRFTIVDKSAYTLLEIIADKLEIRRELCREKKDLIIQSCFSRSGSFHLVLNGWLKLLATDPVKLKEERNGDFVFIRSKRRLCPQKDGQAIQKESESLSA